MLPAPATETRLLEYHPFSPDVLEDPHPVYRRLREEAPCYFLAEWKPHSPRGTAVTNVPGTDS